MSSKLRKTAASAALLCSIISGCSGMDEKSADTPVRVSSEVQDEVEKVSSSILDIISLKAKLTESGAMITSCDGGAYRAYHPWSLYGPPAKALGEVMDKLRGQLPKKGWKIVKDGPDETQVRSPQIIAESTDGKFSLDARFHDGRDGGPAQLEVGVQSACFRPESTATS
ncbi:hypothetical protein [Streptomyces californicus]|uniref:hypothetical protein n=1 Tax=Streptomyces californicus TaxID=67351 RepID=UPI00378BE4C0